LRKGKLLGGEGEELLEGDTKEEEWAEGGGRERLEETAVGS